MRKFKVIYKDFQGREHTDYDEINTSKLSSIICRLLIIEDFTLRRQNCDWVISVEEVE